MINYMKVRWVLFFTGVFGCLILQAQQVDLSAISSFEVYNRIITINNSDGKPQVHMSAAEGDGIAWIKNKIFSAGIIEFDVKGKDVLQQSFVGIAFHGANDSVFDGIYFRPFNFNAADTNRKNHSVQYISMPQYDWEYLRDKYPGKYEHALNSKIEATSWFHVKVAVDQNKISVYVNSGSEPCLTVKPLHDYTNGKIGFWVGNHSDGDFANLVIKPK